MADGLKSVYPLMLSDIQEESIPMQSTASFTVQTRLYLASSFGKPFKCDLPSIPGSRGVRGKNVKFLSVMSFNTKVTEKLKTRALCILCF